MKLLDGVEGGIAVELGVWRGDFAQTMLAENPDELYLIDPWIKQSKEVYNDILNLPNDQNEANYQFVKDRFKRDNNVFLMRKFSHEAVRDIKDIDYIYIDANHSYDSVLSDLFMWYPVVNKVIAGHDYPWPSVRAALDTFTKITGLKYYPVERESWRIDLTKGAMQVYENLFDTQK